jgi:hypothetical protein
MTELSPAAQAVFRAFAAAAHPEPHHQCDAIAAALCAAADQVVPEEPEGGMAPRWIRQEVRRKFLAIAAELKQAANINTTETP